jgi:hypothetical protein
VIGSSVNESCCWQNLNQSQNLFAELLSALGTGYRGKELLPAEALHLAEDYLEGSPIGDGLLKPVILLLG